MSLELETRPTLGARPYRPDISTLRDELMNIREELLLEISHAFCQHSEPRPACILREEVITLRMHDKLRPIERALNTLLDAPPTICRDCHMAIPTAQLMLPPESPLCAACIDGRVDMLSADAL